MSKKTPSEYELPDHAIPRKGKPFDRYKPARIAKFPPESGVFACTNPDILERLGSIASFFPHIEEGMAKVLAVLMRASDETAARYIYRAVVSSDAKIKTMVRLFETPFNKDLDTFYDDAVAEFRYINGCRNDYLHGLWYTRENDGATFLSTPVGDPFAFMFGDRRKVTAKELDGLLARMGKLNLALQFRCGSDLWKRYQQLQELHEKAARTSRRSGRRARKIEAPQPPPAPSRASQRTSVETPAKRRRKDSRLQDLNP